MRSFGMSKAEDCLYKSEICGNRCCTAFQGVDTERPISCTDIYEHRYREYEKYSFFVGNILLYIEVYYLE